MYTSFEVQSIDSDIYIEWLVFCQRRQSRWRTSVGTYNVAGLTIGLLLHSIERLSSELVVTDDAGEAIHVEDLIHGGASCPFSNHILPTASAAAYKIKGCLLQRNSWIIPKKPRWQRQQVHPIAAWDTALMVLLHSTVTPPQSPLPSLH